MNNGRIIGVKRTFQLSNSEDDIHGFYVISGKENRLDRHVYSFVLVFFGTLQDLICYFLRESKVHPLGPKIR